MKIDIASYLKEKGFGDSNQKKLEARIDLIRRNNGKFALINDEHYCLQDDWVLVQLRYAKGDNMCYYAKILNNGKRIEKRFHYDDLLKIIPLNPSLSGYYL